MHDEAVFDVGRAFEEADHAGRWLPRGDKAAREMQVTTSYEALESFLDPNLQKLKQDQSKRDGEFAAANAETSPEDALAQLAEHKGDLAFADAFFGKLSQESLATLIAHVASDNDGAGSQGFLDALVAALPGLSDIRENASWPTVLVSIMVATGSNTGDDRFWALVLGTLSARPVAAASFVQGFVDAGLDKLMFGISGSDPTGRLGWQQSADGVLTSGLSGYDGTGDAEYVASRIDEHYQRSAAAILRAKLGQPQSGPQEAPAVNDFFNT